LHVDREDQVKNSTIFETKWLSNHRTAQVRG
jgi:hypothetical protein